ncbi:MAG: hypothetical protein JO301_11920 [Chitinophagaceae bacterium]|nr:hypothetical protein [Chitinophagaceae bacterium]
MKQIRIILLLLAFIPARSLMAQRGGTSRTLTLQFHHNIGIDTLELGNTYINALGDTVTIQRFRYYVSNFALVDKNGRIHTLPEQYFLVDEADPASKTIVLGVPASAELIGVRFMLGVDSARNVSGVQTGVLDPSRGMFWTWNSGYVMAKLEGSSPSAHVAGNIFTYHIGGYRQPMSTMRFIELPIASSAATLDIVADINRWFKGNSELHIGATPVCHSPGALAARIADNYAGMFSIKPLP